MRPLTFSKFLLVALCSAIPVIGYSSSACADWASSAQAGGYRDSNLNNAELAQDIVSGTVLSADFSTTGTFFLEAGNSLSVTGESRVESFDSASGMNNLSLGAALAYRKKWALGPYAPWSGVSLSSTNFSFANNIRNGWRHQLAISSGQRIFERWDVRAEYMVERRTADTLPPDQPGISGDAFSQTSRSIALNAEYAWSDNLSLAFGSLLRHGDVVTSARETAKIISASRAIAVDTVFGPDFYAYRMFGTTYGLNVDMNYTVNSRNLLRASMMRQVTHATGENNYAKSVAMLSWLYNF